ncbi:MAG: archaeosortase/exosortase family protein, partial [Chloroflexota bacterium]
MKHLNAIIFLATILLFAPTWLWLGEAWLSDPYYSHGPLVLIVALYFAWTQRHALTVTVPPSLSFQAERGISTHSEQDFSSQSFDSAAKNAAPLRTLLETTGWLFIVLALAAHLWALFWRAYYISALMIPLALLGLLIALYGWQTARRFWFPLAFLIFMIPLPIAERFGPSLESFAASSATTLAQWIGIAARNEGAQVF